MALSVFLRSTFSQAGGCYMKSLAQGSVRLSSSIFNITPTTIHVSKPVNLQAMFHKPNAPTPITDSVRYLKTSAVRKDFVREDTSDHSKLWVVEKSISAALLVLVPAALIYPSKIIDIALAIACVSHVYWGLEAIVVDYIRVVLFGPIIPKIAKILLIAVMVATVGGLYNLIFHDIGIGRTIRQLWSLQRPVVAIEESEDVKAPKK